MNCIPPAQRRAKKSRVGSEGKPRAQKKRRAKGRGWRKTKGRCFSRCCSFALLDIHGTEVRKHGSTETRKYVLYEVWSDDGVMTGNVE